MNQTIFNISIIMVIIFIILYLWNRSNKEHLAAHIGASNLSHASHGSGGK